MGYYEKQFYDREKEREAITQKVKENKSKGQLIFLAGTTGVGKSGLAQKLLQDELSDYKSVVLCIGKSSVGTIENLSYFNTLYRKLIEAARQRKDYGIRTAEQYNRRNIVNWLQIAFEAVKSWLHIDPNRHLAEPAEEYSVSRKKEYIVSVLKNGPFIINIQNIQNIDTHSAELIQTIIKLVPSVKWIMEYTLPADEIDSQFYSFVNEWKSTGIEYSLYKIKQLEFDLALRLAPPDKMNNPIQRKQLETRYEKSQGNLLTLMVVPDDLDADEDHIKIKLESLNQDEKYIVYILYLNEAPISKTMLLSILTKASASNQQVCFSINKAEIILRRLIEDNIIAEQNESYSIKHDSLIEKLSHLPVTPVLFLAYRALESCYLRKMDKETYNQEECINHLFSLYIRFHDENLASLFPKLSSLILAAKYPKDIIKKIEQYMQQIVIDGGTNVSILYSVSCFLTELCIKLQYPQLAQESLDLIYSIRPSQYLVGLQGAIYALRSTPENCEKLDALIDRAEEGSRLELSLRLCRLRIMMRSCDSVRSKKYAEELLLCEEYKNTPEYGFLLYNAAEFQETPLEALNCYRRALCIFEEFGLVHMQAEVNISMSMSYSYAGQLKNARRSIRRAEELAPGHISETVLLNNNAVIDILDGKISVSTLNNLADAALMDVNPYEVLIIKSNWLVSLTLSQHIDQAADLACEIECSGYETYQYEDFLHIIYQNLLFYYTQIEDGQKASLYTQKLINLSMRDKISPETRKLIQMMLQKKHVSDVFYTRFPFRVDFLGFWGLEISRDLESFQLGT